MLRACWVGCVVVFTGFVIACSAPPPKTEASERWSKSHRPGWANELPASDVKAWEEMFNLPDPLYASVLHMGKDRKFEVHRKKWAKFSPNEVLVHTKIAALLPHEPDTIMYFIDNESRETLAQFTNDTKFSDAIKVHP